MRISDWSSDVCSSDLDDRDGGAVRDAAAIIKTERCRDHRRVHHRLDIDGFPEVRLGVFRAIGVALDRHMRHRALEVIGRDAMFRSEEHPSELQSLMRISYAVFFLRKNI